MAFNVVENGVTLWPIRPMVVTSEALVTRCNSVLKMTGGTNRF